MLSHENLFQFVLADLAEEMSGYQPPEPNPLPCDRYIARSALQKAVRRGEVALAHRSVANLYQHDPRAVWRHVVIIAMEDCGASTIDLLGCIVAARLDRKWRQRAGGDWRVLCFLTERMAKGVHCQAACDLLLCALNRPENDQERSNALEAGPAELASMIADAASSLQHRAIATLALGGGLAEGQQHRQPACVFAILEAQGVSPHVIATCHAAWRASRNEMALLLPIVWQAWAANDGYVIEDDTMLPVTMIGDVPDYALDQFTRTGNNAFRSSLVSDPAMKELLLVAGVPVTQHVKALGDLLFLTDGTQLVRRVIWKTGEELRSPRRMLPWIAILGRDVYPLIACIAEKHSQIAQHRAQQFHRVNQLSA
ncbi:MAG: hypothetical protein V4533_12915 [Pseudomonadota bacterium]|jgi:hypothetical protein